jgi:hypothetical protein
VSDTLLLLKIKGNINLFKSFFKGNNFRILQKSKAIITVFFTFSKAIITEYYKIKGNHQNLRLLRVARNDAIFLIFGGGWFVGGFSTNKPPSFLTPNNIVIANEVKQSFRILRYFTVSIKCSLKEI